jgi:hypothetical protein
MESNSEKYTLLAAKNNVQVFHKWIGEIRFGPELFALKSSPKIEFLETGIYGEWSFIYKNFLFLQKWNSEKNADANIIQINTETLAVTTIKKNILSVFWEARVIDENQIEFNFKNTNTSFLYNLENK